jgi:RNA polymerase sigma-70 factor (ECF subfamily)
MLSSGPMMGHLWEGEAVLALSQADFNQMVTDHGPALYRMAFRMIGDRHEAEDIVQETFRSVWGSRRRYEAGRGERAWLVSILRRRVIDRWRRRPPPSVLAFEDHLEVASEDANPLDAGYTDEMQHALNQLPAELRETVLLVVVAELTHQEAAYELNVPLGTVMSRVSRARQRLRESLMANARRTKAESWDRLE